MKLICPKCGYRFDAEQASRDEGWRAMTGIAGRFGQYWKVADEYADCFRPTEFSPVTFKKKLRLLGLLLEIFDSEIFEYNGKRYRTTRQAIVKGMAEICNRQKYGLGNNNYLKVILLKTAERISAEGLTAREEARREEERRQRPVDGRQGSESVRDILRKVKGRFAE